jgi:SAM-dependent methyltransferase
MSSQEFTGERFIPGKGGVQLAYEHLHRYFFALRWARGKRVLDVASGSGYGAALLAGVAGRVWALDIDGAAVARARSTCTADNLCFVHADAGHLPFAAASLDLAVAFEVIEHLSDQEGLVRELARVLKAGGIALVSTPDKAIYSDARQYVNPFHVREFYRDEFRALLQTQFAIVRLMGQQVRAGSLISAEPAAEGPSEVHSRPLPDAGRAESAPMYWLAICSQQTPRAPIGPSAYLDPADSLIYEWTDRLKSAGAEIERLNEEVRELGRWGKDLEGQIVQRDETLKRVLAEVEKRINEEIGARDRTIQSLHEEIEAEVGSRDQVIAGLQGEIAAEVGSRDQVIAGLQGEIAAEVGSRDRTIQGLQEEFETRTKWALSLLEDVRVRDERLVQTNTALSAAAEHLARIRHAFLYRILCRLGILPK